MQSAIRIDTVSVQNYLHLQQTYTVDAEKIIYHGSIAKK